MTVLRVGVSGVVVFALSLQAGCSFLFVHGPPANHAELASLECSDSNAWPVVDVIWAGLNGVGAASAAGDNTNPNKDQILAVGISWLVVSGISAIYGFSEVSACGDAKRLREPRFVPHGVSAQPALPVPAALATPPIAAPAGGPAPVVPGVRPSRSRSLAMRPALAD